MSPLVVDGQRVQQSVFRSTKLRNIAGVVARPSGGACLHEVMDKTVFNSHSGQGREVIEQPLRRQQLEVCARLFDIFTRFLCSKPCGMPNRKDQRETPNKQLRVL